MKTKLSILILLFGLLAQVQAQSVSTPGIISGKNIGASDMSNDFFNRKEKRYDKSRNEQLREQNQRLQRRIEVLERDLDDCSADRARTRYPKRRYDSNFNLQQNYWGERRIEKEYEELKKENVFLRDYHDWLARELDDCQRTYQRDRRGDYRRPDYGRDRDYRDRDSRDRDYRDRDYKDHDSCSCQKHGSSHPGKGKGNGQYKHHPHCKYGKHGGW